MSDIEITRCQYCGTTLRSHRMGELEAARAEIARLEGEIASRDRAAEAAKEIENGSNRFGRE